jgi:hypothetical protein
MPTLTVYGEASDGFIDSDWSSYATARLGGGFKTAYPSGNSIVCGQSYWSTPLYRCTELYIQYNTSAIPGAATIIAVNEYLYVIGYGGSYTEEVRAYNWGASLDTTDWISGADLGGYTLLCSITSPAVSGYFAFPGNNDFLAYINTTGNTIIIHNSSKHRLGTAPTATEYTTYWSVDRSGTTQDPKITIDYSLATPIMTLNKGWW